MPDLFRKVGDLLRKPVLGLLRRHFVGRIVHRFVIADGQPVYMGKGRIVSLIYESPDSPRGAGVYCIWMPHYGGSLNDSVRVPIGDLKPNPALQEWCFYE